MNKRHIISLMLITGMCLIALCNIVKINKTSESNGKLFLTEGDIAPEIKLKNPDGIELSLSALRGKLVLIDFWASWCGPCRRENPNVVNAYNKYKDKKFKNANGFCVYSVSLDKEMSAWKDAIKADQLIWENHVSDLRGWNSSAASLYQITSIPSNYLIDGQGKILAINLRGQALEEMLVKLLDN